MDVTALTDAREEATNKVASFQFIILEGNMTKNYLLKAAQIKRLVSGYGSCYASDKITVDGSRVGFMYRENPDNVQDSGWRFLAGIESQEYLDNPENISIYDVNTIANYDPDIIPFLDAPIDTAYQRDPSSGKLVKDNN